MGHADDRLDPESASAPPHRDFQAKATPTRPTVAARRVVIGEVARLGISSISILYIAAVIGPSARGQLTVLMAASSIASIVCIFGLNSATTYMIASGQWSGREAVVFSLGWTLVTGTIACMIFYGLALTPVGDTLLGNLSPLLLGLSTIGTVVGVFQGAINIGLQQYRATSLMLVAPAVSNLVIFVGLIVLGAEQGDSALIAWTSSVLLAPLPFIAYTTITCRGLFRMPSAKRRALDYGMRTAGANVMNLVNLRIDVLLLRWLAGPSVTGVYGLAVQLSEVSWLVPTAVGKVVFPTVASGRNEDSAQWTCRVSRATTIFALVATLAVAAFGTVIFIWVLPEYRAGVLPIWLLTPGLVARGVGRVVGSDLLGRARPEAHLRAALLSVTVTIAGDLLLIPWITAAGAAIVSSVAYIIYTMVLLRYFSAVTGIPQGQVYVPHIGDAKYSWQKTRTEFRALVRRTRRSASS